MIASLSELLRVSLEGVDEAEIAFARELAFIRRYLEIMQIRFEGRLEIAEQIDPAVEAALIPNLLLQPLVENAFKHGVDRVEGIGRIELRAQRVGERLLLSVRDNGPGLDGGPPAKEGLGLRNTRARLAQLYGVDQSLTLRANVGGGAVVEISLPFHTGSDLRTTVVPDEANPA
jgi:two-component system, LytTR family, sensor kinase